MALNRYMHPDNPYKDKRPDFKEMALEFDEFSQHVTQDLCGVVNLNFKQPGALLALTRTLLKKDFNLDVEIPADRLVPTIPLRCNYLLWVRDILGAECPDVVGLDIGAGSSCIYPLLGHRMFGWKFLATEVDQENFEFARMNVTANSLNNSIVVLKTSPITTFPDIIKKSGMDVFSFSMCNPPFFSPKDEPKNRSGHRQQPSAFQSGADMELKIYGGEEQYVTLMIWDSMRTRENIRVYTTMLGKKSSIKPLRLYLEKHDISNYAITEFCQGKTMRWGLGWSFCPEVIFPAPIERFSPMKYTLEFHRSTDAVFRESILDVSRWVQVKLAEMLIDATCETRHHNYHSFSCVATVAAWGRQRAKRRELARISERYSRERDLSGVSNSVLICAAIISGVVDAAIQPRVDLEFRVCVKRNTDGIITELSYRSGDDREELYQVFQLMANQASLPITKASSASSSTNGSLSMECDS